MGKNTWLTSREVMDGWGINDLTLLEYIAEKALPCYFTGTFEIIDSIQALLRAKRRILGLPADGSRPYALMLSLGKRPEIQEWISKGAIDQLRASLDLVCFRAKDVSSFEIREFHQDNREPNVTDPVTPGEMIPAVQNEMGNYCFARSGSDWLIKYGGDEAKVKDTKGMLYIAHLLENPGIETPILDLVRIVEEPVPADASTVYDSMSADQLEAESLSLLKPGFLPKLTRSDKKLLSEILEEAKDRMDRAIEDGSQEKIEEAQEYLQRANQSVQQVECKDKGVEKTRKAIARSVATARKNIAKELPKFARHLDEYIKVGYSPSYTPGQKIVWHIKK